MRDLPTRVRLESVRADYERASLVVALTREVPTGEAAEVRRLRRGVADLAEALERKTLALRAEADACEAEARDLRALVESDEQHHADEDDDVE